MPDYTAGSYVGPPTKDSDAIIRKIFSEQENQQDGLGTILSFCQKASGYTVGSPDITGFMDQLLQFRGIVDRKDTTGINPSGPKDQVLQQISDFLQPLPDKSKFDKFVGTLHGNFSSNLVHFCIDLQGESLRLYIPKILMQAIGPVVLSICSFETWEVNRDEMTRRADELVEKTKIKESIDVWTKDITSSGF
ncbi:hypothetical protein BGX23_009940 [Mortierella sp. AD031]|nr:hypothetical protein BGX23_009940 [Mortierella sp. AD031]